MKHKLFLVLIAVITVTASSFSQIKLSLGVEGGLNLANISSTPDYGYNSGRTGMLFGASVDIGFGQYFSVAPGLRFIMKGAGYSDANQVLTDKLNYLEIPVLFKATFALTEVKPYILAGPILGINISASRDQTPTGGTTTTTDLSNDISGTDFDLLFGAGVGFKIAPKIDLFAQFGYSLGLSNILKNNTAQTFKTTGIQLTAGAMFRL